MKIDMIGRSRAASVTNVVEKEGCVLIHFAISISIIAN